MYNLLNGCEKHILLHNPKPIRNILCKSSILTCLLLHNSQSQCICSLPTNRTTHEDPCQIISLIKNNNSYSALNYWPIISSKVICRFRSKKYCTFTFSTQASLYCTIYGLFSWAIKFICNRNKGTISDVS